MQTQLSMDLSALGSALLTRVHDESRQGSAKVTVVGTGQVGMAAAFAMMTQVAVHCIPFVVSYQLTTFAEDIIIIIIIIIVYYAKRGST